MSGAVIFAGFLVFIGLWAIAVELRSLGHQFERIESSLDTIAVALHVSTEPKP